MPVLDGGVAIDYDETSMRVEIMEATYLAFYADYRLSS